MLKAIESQHGLLIERSQKVWSFSHLTFQEYLVARHITFKNYTHVKTINSLVEQIFEKRWREVFVLVSSLIENADGFIKLMKNKVDNLLADIEVLQSFIAWLKEKAISMNMPYKLMAVRAIYFDLEGELLESCTLATVCDSSISKIPELISYLDKARINAYQIEEVFSAGFNQAVNFASGLDRALYRALCHARNIARLFLLILLSIFFSTMPRSLLMMKHFILLWILSISIPSFPLSISSLKYNSS
jgi:hypothetical protein